MTAPWRSLCVVAMALAACADGAPPLLCFSGPTMGSTYEVKFVAKAAAAAVQALVRTELDAYDAAFSQWRDDSEIARFNRQTTTEPIAVSSRFESVLRQALAAAALTEGAFDPTVKPLTDLYRARKLDPEHRLDAAAAAAALARVGFRRVAVVDGAVVKGSADVTIDLDGIAAGAAADSIAALLVDHGVTNFYLEVTGEVLCRGEKEPGVPWIVGVVDPSSDAVDGDRAVRTVRLRDRALCTSGGYRNHFIADGKPVHHVIDPRTGRSADHGVISASVLASSAALADALSTAAIVLGEAETVRLWPAWVRAGACGALLLIADGDGVLHQVEIEWPAEAH